jgi:hypothetical protein
MGSTLIQRSEVPGRFPQFRSGAALAYLAHLGRGPRYVLVGGIAWYDPIDIIHWLEINKRTGPVKGGKQPTHSESVNSKTRRSRRRGRPTKLEQMLRLRAK